MKTLLITALLLVGTQTALQAQYSVQVGSMSGKANLSGFKYLLPRSSTGGFNLSRSGDYYDMYDVTKSSSASGLALIFGYEVIDNLNLTFASRNFGTSTAEGTSNFRNITNPNLYKQKLTVKTTALGLGVNYSFDLNSELLVTSFYDPTGKLFVAPFLEYTRATIVAKGTVGETGTSSFISGTFPSKTYSKTGLAYGFNFGYRVAYGFDVLFTYYTTNFKGTDTGVQTAFSPALSKGGKLQSKLNITTTSISLRYNFGLEKPLALLKPYF